MAHHIDVMPWFPYRFPYGRVLWQQVFGIALIFPGVTSGESEQNQLFSGFFLGFFRLANKQFHPCILFIGDL